MPLRPARDDDRNLAGEIDEAFENADLAAHIPPCLSRLGLGVEHRLALTVIAHAHALQHGRVAEIVHRADQRGGVGHLPVSGGRDIDRTQKILLAQTVLRDFENFGAGQDQLRRRHKSHRLGRYIFELEGDHVDRGGEAVQRRQIGEFGDGRGATHLLGRAVWFGREDMTAIAEPRRSERRHPPKLTAAQNPDRRPRSQHRLGHHRGSGRSATRSV